MAIELHQFPTGLGMPNISPFCMKLETWLRLAGLAYEIKWQPDPRKAPVGKLPMVVSDGETICDSERIIQRLSQKHGIDLDAELSPQQRAQAELWEDYADELLYWYEVYLRVNDPDALDQAVALSMEGRPAVERLPVKLSLRTMLRISLAGQGLGRMKREDVHAEFLRQLDRIETLLPATGWLVGENKTIADIAVGSQLLEVVRTSPMRREIEQRPRLWAWLQRI